MAKLRERISVSKRARQKFHLERFDLKKFYDEEVKEKYQVEIANRFVALESLDGSFDINNAWQSIRENITLTLMMMTEMDIEMSVYYVHLTRLIAREDYIKY
jgi:hypothetical protein